MHMNYRNIKPTNGAQKYLDGKLALRVIYHRKTQLFQLSLNKYFIDA